MFFPIILISFKKMSYCLVIWFISSTSVPTPYIITINGAPKSYSIIGDDVAIPNRSPHAKLQNWSTNVFWSKTLWCTWIMEHHYS